MKNLASELVEELSRQHLAYEGRTSLRFGSSAFRMTRNRFVFRFATVDPL
jgi:hypothetical protein